MTLQRFAGRYRQLPNYGKVLVGLSLVLLLLSGGYYAVLTFSGTAIRGGTTTSNTSFRWSSDRLVLYNSSSSDSVTCTARPVAGGQFGISVPSQPRNSFIRTKFASPEKTFPGTAKVTCTGDANAFEGGLAGQFALVSSPLYKVAAVGIIAAPLIVLVLIQGNRRARQRRHSES